MFTCCQWVCDCFHWFSHFCLQPLFLENILIAYTDVFSKFISWMWQTEQDHETWNPGNVWPLTPETAAVHTEWKWVKIIRVSVLMGPKAQPQWPSRMRGLRAHRSAVNLSVWVGLCRSLTWPRLHSTDWVNELRGQDYTRVCAEAPWCSLSFSCFCYSEENSSGV